MKIDHHEFRVSMGMFELTPDDITKFAKWLISKDEDLKKFLNKDIQEKRTVYASYSALSAPEILSEESE